MARRAVEVDMVGVDVVDVTYIGSLMLLDSRYWVWGQMINDWGLGSW